ncbi:energy transducer TonB [Methylotenera sp. N17]|uniref:energy transducer TonB n=1 Tax=Methylotenera sp. N17 TaxID=1502761 RepID=UPI00068DBEE1|nr:energy transducer TonB [Methylotenera sp. N17]
MTFGKLSHPHDDSLDFLEKQPTPVLEKDYQLRYALLLSLVLHITAYFWLPYLKQTPLPKPTRFEVELSNLLAQAPSQPASNPAPAQPKPVQEPVTPPVQKQVVKPTPVVKPREVTPVLTAESPEASADYEVPTTQAKPSESQASTNTPQSSTTSTTAHANSEASNSDSTKTSENATPSEASPEEAWDGYGQQLQDLVGKNKNYPAIAIRRNWEGTVKLLAKFVAGRLVDVTIMESSQRQALDDEAMRMLKKAVAQIPVKGALASKNFTVVVPVDFKLN